MDKNHKRQWDLGPALIALAGALIATLVGLHQFNKGEEDRLREEHALVVDQDTVSFRRRLWLDRLDAYRSLAQLAGEIVANAGDAKSADLEKQYLAAYWGTTVMVEDKTVENAMINFQLAILDYQAKRVPLDDLKRKAYDLVQACRKSAAAGMPPT